MKKELVIKVAKRVGPVIMTGLGITAIMNVRELKRQRNQAVSELCSLEVGIKIQEVMIDNLLEVNEKLFKENQSLKESAVSKKKKV